MTEEIKYYTGNCITDLHTNTSISHCNEEIIIDGVNVAGCDFVSKIGGCDSYTDGVCEGHNCEHKQLKRLEQENKELKEEIDKYYQQTLDDEILMNELSLEVDLRKKESDFYLEKLSKYRSALEEIKEIVIKATDISYSIEVNSMLYDIKDKINEVLE